MGESQADDVAQEVFLLVRRKLDSFDADSMRPWLYGITRNVSRNWLRSRWRRAKRTQVVAELAPEPSDDWERVREAATLMDRFLQGLPPKQREAFRLKVIEEFTAAEISAALGVPMQTVYSRVRSATAALETFRASLEDGA